MLILPFGVSAVVSGAVFRLIFDPNPERGMASALFGGGATWLGPDLIWWVLASAFAWSWLGFVVVLFRAGLDTTGGPGLRVGRLTLPRPGPVTSIVVLTVLVAAIRVFDLVLIATPGSIQDDVDVVGLHWWRMTSRDGDTGGPALLAVLLFLVVALVGSAGMRAMRRPEQTECRAAAGRRRSTGRHAGGAGRCVGLVGLMWILPVVVLVATAFHDPEAAGALGWWRLRRGRARLVRRGGRDLAVAGGRRQPADRRARDRAGARRRRAGRVPADVGGAAPGVPRAHSRVRDPRGGAGADVRGAAR